MIKKSILILGSFSPGALELQYSKNLKLQGWEVKWIDIQLPVHRIKNKNLITKIIHRLNPEIHYATINKLVLKEAKIFSPLFILVFKGMELFPQTIRELKSYCKIICNYNPDHPFEHFSKGAGNSNVRESIPFFDVHFSYSNSICNQLRENYQTDAYCIPFGYDETLVSVKVNNHDIENQFLFIGAWDNERQRKLESISAIELQLFGPQIWAKKIGATHRINYHSAPQYEQDYANACLNASGIINLLRPQNMITDSHNMRTFEVPGYGGLLISERTSEQQYFFEEDNEAIFFEHIEELNEKLKFYSAQQSLVQKMKLQALNRSKKSNYSYRHRAEMLIEYISTKIE